MATVTIKEVSKTYGQEQALHRVSLSMDKGEFVAVVGPSGCGKSTLLRLVAGLDDVSQGQILINGQCVNQIHPSKRDIAMVFQSYALYPHMTVYDNMAYGLKMRGMAKNDIGKRVQEVAELLQLSPYLQRKPLALSGGQRQRVAMGRAIVRSPAVFLFDEPLSNLDPKLRMEMRYEIKKLHQQLNTTCLYVTHDQTEAMTLASRVLVLHQGQVEQLATPKMLYQQPATIFVAGFMGGYPINFVEARVDLKAKTVTTELGTVHAMPALTNAIDDRAHVVIGIRPEHLTISPRGQAGTLAVTTRFIDDLGADKLIQVQSLCGKLLTIRTAEDELISHNELGLQLSVEKANLFDKTTGVRLGGWQHGRNQG